MTSRIQTQRFSATGQRPSNGTRQRGELWLNLPDLRLGMIDPTQAPVDLLPIRVYAPTAGYTAGDFVVNAGQLLQARITIAPKAFAITDWNQFQSIAQTDTRYLALSGGALTGPLTLSGNPTQPAQAANKSYVDTTVAAATSSTLASVSATYLPLAGGVLSGALGVGGFGISYPSLGGFWAAHHTALAWDGTNYFIAADGGNTGVIATQSWVSANYLSLAGGALHGPLSVNGGITYSWTGSYAHAMSFGWDGNIQCWVDGSYEGALATQGYVVGNYLPLAGGTVTGALRDSAGRIISQNSGGSPSVTVWDVSGGYAFGMFAGSGVLAFSKMDGSGNPSGTLAYLDGSSNLVVTGTLSTNGNSITLSAASGNYSLNLAGWALDWQSSTGNLVWLRNDGLVLFYCDSGGTIRTHADLGAGGNVSAVGSVSAQAAVYAVNGGMGLYAGGSGRVMQMASNWYWDWNSSNGNLGWMTPSGLFWFFRSTDGVSYNNVGPVGGVGAYQNNSDIRGKENIADAEAGLAEILQLRPVSFTRISKLGLPPKTELGFIAQELRNVIPEAVSVLGIELPDGSGGVDSHDPTLATTLDPIVAALVNAVKQIWKELKHDPAQPD